MAAVCDICGKKPFFGKADQPPVGPAHPARARARGRHPAPGERLYLVHQGGVGHPRPAAPAGLGPASTAIARSIRSMSPSFRRARVALVTLLVLASAAC